MKFLAVGLAIGAAITSFVAAYEWYRSSQVEIKPTWDIEPGEREDSQAGWTAGTMHAFGESSKLSKRAALWALASAILALASAGAGYFK